LLQTTSLEIIKYNTTSQQQLIFTINVYMIYHTIC